MGLPPGENTVTSCLENNTVHSASHMVPTPTRVLVKDCMMYTVFGKSATNCGIVSVAVANDLFTCPVVVPTLICGALMLVVPFGAVGEM